MGNPQWGRVQLSVGSVVVLASEHASARAGMLWMTTGRSAVANFVKHQTAAYQVPRPGTDMSAWAIHLTVPAPAWSQVPISGGRAAQIPATADTPQLLTTICPVSASHGHAGARLVVSRVPRDTSAPGLCSVGQISDGSLGKDARNLLGIRDLARTLTNGPAAHLPQSPHSSSCLWLFYERSRRQQPTASSECHS